MTRTMSVKPSSGLIAMPDSTIPANLPLGYPAYLGYVDGAFPTMPQLAVLFSPGAQLVGLTVTGATLEADGIDVEPGNVNVAGARVWVQKKLAAEPGFRPVIYASVEGQPNFGMGTMIAALTRNGIGLERMRLLSAHYGQGPHICGPGSCGLIDREMDGTQWTDCFLTPSGDVVDMSMLAADFFGQPSETERLVQELGTVQQGDTGAAVKTVQGLLNARLQPPALAIDGVFGIKTLSAVKFLQSMGKVTVDGVVGPLTWPVLLAVN